MTADVQRELAEADDLRDCLMDVLSRGVPSSQVWALADALLPTVQALIADAEKRAAAAALAKYASWLISAGLASAGQLSELRARLDSLDPSGAAEGAGR